AGPSAGDCGRRGDGTRTCRASSPTAPVVPSASRPGFGSAVVTTALPVSAGPVPPLGRVPASLSCPGTLTRTSDTFLCHNWHRAGRGGRRRPPLPPGVSADPGQLVAEGRLVQVGLQHHRRRDLPGAGAH